MNIWPFKKQQKSFDQVSDPMKNDILKALYSWNVSPGVVNFIEDNLDSYIEQGYNSNDDVFSILNRIDRMSTQARLALWTVEAGKWKEVTDHELCNFIRAANPTMTLTEFKQGHLIYKLLLGNSFWYKPTIEVGLNKGKTLEVWLMPAPEVNILGGSSWMNPVGGYNLITNLSVTFKTSDVYHSKFFNPNFGKFGSLYGQSPLKAARQLIAKQNEATLTELKQFTNQSPPYLLFKKSSSGAAGMFDELTPTQREEIQNIIDKYIKRKKPAVMPSEFGKVDLGASAVDLNIINSTVDGRRRLCNIWQFPAQLMNDEASTTDNNVKEMRKQAWTDCIKPNLDDFANGLTSFLISQVPEYSKKGLFFAYDYSDVPEMQQDMAVKVTWMKQAYWTPNEIRDATGAKPFANPAMDEPWVGISEQPLSEATAPIIVEPPIIPNKGDY